MILCEYLFMRCMSSALGAVCGLLYGAAALADPSRAEVDSPRREEVDATGDRRRRDWSADMLELSEGGASVVEGGDCGDGGWEGGDGGGRLGGV